MSLGIWKYESGGGWRDGLTKRELKVEGFSVLFSHFSLKIKTFLYSFKDGGFDVI